jgi:hypothetical protein
MNNETSLAFLEQVRSDVKQLLQDSTELLVTTRLDNDDSFHRKALERIQQEIAGHLLGQRAEAFERLGEEIKGIAINFSHGCQLQIEPHYEFAHWSHPANAFISVVEKVGDKYDVLTTWTVAHGVYAHDKRFQLWQIEDGRYWMQIVHDANIVNDMIGYPSLQISELDEFGIDTTPIHLSRARFFRQLILWVRMRATNSIKWRIKSITKR